ncbi:MAG: VCBS repeat-containing protein [Planctomycetes bacterium]|nr:VCBS repeat-containing protein [Planctomycetota bacterium]
MASSGSINNNEPRWLAVGAPSNTICGSVFIFSADTGGHICELQNRHSLNSDRFGNVLAAVDDLDGDGINDLIVGSPDSSNSTSGGGSVYAYSGNTWRILWRTDGREFNGGLGSSIARCGDVDGDGIADIIAGSARGSESAPSSGIVTILSGADGHSILRVEGREIDSAFGLSVAGAGDINKDGVPDIVVGSPYENINNVPEAGAVRVFSGRDGTPLAVIPGTKKKQHFGIVMTPKCSAPMSPCDAIVIGSCAGSGSSGTIRIETRTLPGLEILKSSIINISSREMVFPPMAIAAGDVARGKNGNYYIAYSTAATPSETTNHVTILTESTAATSTGK